MCKALGQAKRVLHAELGIGALWPALRNLGSRMFFAHLALIHAFPPLGVPRKVVTGRD
jgi:hypothetical protein